MSVNRVCVSGNLTRDSELRATQAGNPILHVGLAVNERRKNPQSGDWEDYPNFVDCVMFGSRAEKLQPYLTKGAKVAIEGRLRYSSWERDGQKRSKLEVIVDEIDLMSRPSQQGGQQAAPQQAPYQAPTPELRNAQTMVQTAMPGSRAVAPEPDVYDADIPF